MRYLIETCGFTKIGFVGGPETSNGARVREGIYRDEMGRHGLAVPSRLVVHGDYSGECPEVIEKLIDDNPDLEAIACCCDLIAHTAYDIMRERGLSVGRDIAVTGFDDLPFALSDTLLPIGRLVDDGVVDVSERKSAGTPDNAIHAEARQTPRRAVPYDLPTDGTAVNAHKTETRAGIALASGTINPS